MDDWPVDRDLDEQLRRIVNEEVAAADPRQIRLRPVVGAGRPWVRTGLALVAVVALIAVLAWRAQPAPPYAGDSGSPSATPSAGQSESPTSTPTLAPTPALTSSPAPTGTLTPGLTPGPTANPALKPSKTLGCAWDGGFAVALADGRVLVSGGSCQPAIFDPATRMFHATGAMTANRVNGTPTLLKDGRVLITGGYDAVLSAALTIDEIYDPKTGRFTPIGPVEPHVGTATVLLQDGRVLIVPSDTDATLPDIAQIFDPTKGTFTATGPLVGDRDIRTAVLLDDGKVLVINADAQPIRTQVYDPVTNSFRATRGQVDGFMPLAVRLPDGRVMIFGSDFADAYDPSTDTFSQLAGPPHLSDVMACTTTLTGGRILAIGPADDVSQPSSGWRPTSGWLFDPRPPTLPRAASEHATTARTLAGVVYDPVTGKWTYLGHLSREYLAGIGLAPLPGGGAIVIGLEPGGSGHATTELFDPKLMNFTVSE